MTDWRDPAFLAGTNDWVRSHVTVTGAIEQPHVQWWSTVLRVPTSDGPVWFKAVVEGATYEPPLTEMLARLRPRFIPDLIAIDHERGWMLMRGRDPTPGARRGARGMGDDPSCLRRAAARYGTRGG